MLDLSDIKYAVRFLARTPAFTMPAVASLALGIAGTSVMLSLVSATLLRPLDATDASQLVRIGRSAGGDGGFRSLSVTELQALRERTTSFDTVFGEEMVMVAVSGGGGADPVAAEVVTGNYFGGLRVTPALGRGFSPSEEGTPATVALLSDRLWRHRFNADAAIIGRTIAVNNVPLTIVGVAPPEFAGTFPGLPIDLWIPIGSSSAVFHQAPTSSPLTLQVMGRLRTTVSLAAARAELQWLAERLADEDASRPRNRGFSIAWARGVHPAFQGPARVALLLLLTAVGLVLLVACANVASLQLARGQARSRELAIRTAVGATRGRLIRQLMIESVVLALAGGSAGMLLALWPIRLLNRLMQALGPEGIALSPNLQVDGQVMVWTSLAAVLSAVVFGLTPTLRITRQPLARAVSHKAPMGLSAVRSWWRGSLTIAQVAVSTVLLIAAALVMRSLHRTTTIDVGFRPEGVIVGSFADQQSFGRDRAAIARFHDEWLSRVRTTPTVDTAAFADFIPLAQGAGHPQRVRVPGREQEDLTLSVGTVTEGYFAVLGQTMRGRDFTAAERRDTAAVVIVNESMGRQVWPEGEAIGQFLRIGDEEAERQVVGVVANGRYTSFADRVPPLVFVPGLTSNAVLHARTSLPIDEGIRLVRTQATEIEPRLPPFRGRSLQAAMASSLVPLRIVQFVLALAGVMVLLLSAGGLYGLVRFTVAEREHEVGIRMALGATSLAVFRTVAGRAVRYTILGIVIGSLGGIAASRVMAGLLYGIGPVDPVAFSSVAAVLLSVAVAAGSAALRLVRSRDLVRLLRAD